MRILSGLPLTRIWSPGWMRCPRCAGSPLTDTRPSWISSSISRREPMPPCASTLCSLGASGEGASTRRTPGSAVSASSTARSKSPDTTSSMRTGGLPGRAPDGAGAGLPCPRLRPPRRGGRCPCAPRSPAASAEAPAAASKSVSAGAPSANSAPDSPGVCPAPWPEASRGPLPLRRRRRRAPSRRAGAPASPATAAEASGPAAADGVAGGAEAAGS